MTRNGLFDYLAKPVEADAFSSCLQRARTRIEHLKVNLKSDQMVTESPAMREVALQLQQAARHATATVLLTGETGSGKDVAARALHEWTHGATASQAPFIAVNCASIPAEMFEAELFGAEKGAYTGADKIREGLAGATKEGTLFLDEIGEVPLPLQAKLLRFLEAREYRPLGSSNTRLFAGRVIAATNRLLRKEAAAGTFREDLMYRLDSFMVRMPPLRERRDEIPALAIRLLAQLAAKYHRKPPKLRDEDLNTLASYEFPGNVRELRNLMERSLLRSPLDSVTLALDHAWLNRPESAGVAPAAPVMKQAVGTTSASTASTRDLPPIESQEYEMIRQALAESNGGIRRAAARLGISHQALLRRLQKWPELRPQNPE